MSQGDPPSSGQWAADPTGRHELRYWDGARWTDHVVDGDVQATDPLAAALPARGATIGAGAASPVTTRATRRRRRPWYRRKGAAVGAGVAVLVVAVAIAAALTLKSTNQVSAKRHGTPATTTATTLLPTTTVPPTTATTTPPTTVPTPPTTVRRAATTVTTQRGAVPAAACLRGTYKNSLGHMVCNPYPSAKPPAGAAARCVDGFYSFSETRSGTCSGHGGVAQWLR